MTSSRRTFEALALLEGASLMLLLCVAMPLKYFAGIPEATRALGLIHGLAFIAYELRVLNALGDQRWSRRTIVLGVVAGFLPLATFFFVAHVRRAEATLSVDER